MAREIAIALGFLLFSSLPSAFAQMGGMPMGGIPAMGDMTDEQADAMAAEMMQRYGAMMGLDPEALRNATAEEQQRMLEAGANAMAERMTQGLEQALGMPLEEIQNLSDEEMRALVLARPQPEAALPPIEPRPLRTMPRDGFPDGSMPLPTAPDYQATLVYDEPPERDLLLIVVDPRANEIIWRETRTAPFEEHLSLLEIASDPSVLILEVIDPQTRRVLRRYRPAALVGE